MKYGCFKNLNTKNFKIEIFSFKRIEIIFKNMAQNYDNLIVRKSKFKFPKFITKLKQSIHMIKTEILNRKKDTT